MPPRSARQGSADSASASSPSPSPSPSPAEHKAQLALLFRILGVIRDRRMDRRLRREDIADSVGVGSIRTLQRYLTILTTEGLIQQGGRRIGYVLTEEGGRLPALPLDASDRLALSLARALLSGPGIPEADAIDRALGKVTAVAAPSTTLRQMVSSLFVTEAAQPAPTSPLVWTLAQAVTAQRVVAMDYTTQSRGERAWRRIDPYGIELQGGRVWHVHAYCHRRAELRTFRLDDIHELRETDELFTRDEQAWQEFRGQEGIFAGLRGGSPVEVRVRFAPEAVIHALRRPWPRGLSISRETDGTALLVGVARGTEGILTEVLRWRQLATVEGGDELRTRVTQEIAAMAALYAPTEK